MALLGNGGGSFAPSADFLPTGRLPNSLISEDFNGDGRPDLAMTNLNSESVTTLQGNGIGGFGLGAVLTGFTNPYAVTSNDFNGDDKPDLAVTNAAINRVSVLLGDGSGDFGTKADFATGGNSPTSVTSDDFNRDGMPDLATTDRDSDTVSVLLGDGSGGFGAGAEFTTGSSPESLVSTDFNRDGRTDLAAANLDSNNVSVMLGDGSGIFGPKTDFATGETPYAVISDDFNRDGMPDLATANFEANTVSVLLGGGGSKPSGKKARIGRVKVGGPAKVRNGKKATYKVRITNSGNARANGVELKVKGKGVRAKKTVGRIAAGKTRTIKVSLKFKKPGRIKAAFRVTSKNAGGKTVKKKIRVRR